MPRTKTTPPVEPTREKGQKSLDLPSFFLAVSPQFRKPAWMKAELWRAFVDRQPIAVTARDNLISNITALDWSVEARDSEKRDEYKDEIDHWESFFEYDGTQDYMDRTERLLEDVLDTPFGGAMETVREGDRPGGEVVDLIPIDAATLFPTLSNSWPVGQQIQTFSNDVVYFPTHAINRLGYAPRPDIYHEGWYCPPPERIYLAMELLGRGDTYYASLLLDTPPAGILDLQDMEKTNALEWIQSFREFMGGTEVLKIPVLYEHTKAAEFIAFGKDPNELLYDKVTLKYAAIVCAGYGETLSDIGFGGTSSGGETLAGTIRNERKTRRTGVSRIKKKLKYWYDRLLPAYLEYNFIDLDDELSIALGRARLATATALAQLINLGVLTPGEGRKMLISDGLVSFSLPEQIPEGELPPPQPNANPERPNMLGRPISPSQGGQGEVLPRSLTTKDDLVSVLEEVSQELNMDIDDIKKEQFVEELLPALDTQELLIDNTFRQEFVADKIEQFFTEMEYENNG